MMFFFKQGDFQVPAVNFLGCTLPETNIAPENGWLEYDCFFLGWPIFMCYLSFREGKPLAPRRNVALESLKSPRWDFGKVPKTVIL